MNRNRMVAAIFFSGVIVATLLALVILEFLNVSGSVTVFVLKQDVQAGAPVTQDLYTLTQLHAVGNQLTVCIANQSPPVATCPGANAQLVARANLHTGDVLRTDDLAATDQFVTVSVHLSNSPPLSPGNLIDLYAVTPNGVVLIGPNLTVGSLAGSGLVLRVPAKNESLWTAIGASQTELVAVQLNAYSQLTSAQANAASAICQLAGPPPQGQPTILDCSHT